MNTILNLRSKRKNPAKNFVKFISIALGALSIFSLLQQGMEFGLSSVAKSIITYYDVTLGAIFSKFEPLAVFAIEYFNEYFDLELTLLPHWKHVFVLLWLYFFADAATDYELGFTGTAIFLIVWGLLIAFSVSIIAGSINSNPLNWKSNFGIAFVPVVGAFVFTIVRRMWHATFLLDKDGETNSNNIEKSSRFTSWWISLKGTLIRGTFRTIFAAVIAGIVLLFPVSRSLANPGLVIFAFLTFLLAVNWLVLGFFRARTKKQPNQSFWSVYKKQSPTKLGHSMMTIFYGLIVLCVINVST